MLSCESPINSFRPKIKYIRWYVDMSKCFCILLVQISVEAHICVVTFGWNWITDMIAKKKKYISVKSIRQTLLTPTPINNLMNTDTVHKQCYPTPQPITFLHYSVLFSYPTHHLLSFGQIRDVCSPKSQQNTCGRVSMIPIVITTHIHSIYFDIKKKHTST